MDIMLNDPVRLFMYIYGKLMTMVTEDRRSLAIGYHSKILIRRTTIEENISRELQTLRRLDNNYKPQIVCEPISHMFAQEVQVEYATSKVDFGYSVAQKHTITPLEAARKSFDTYTQINKLGASGGVFVTMPNKKASKFEQMLKIMKRENVFKLYTDPTWKNIAYSTLKEFTIMRLQQSRRNIELCRGGEDIFAYHNEEAGTGLYYHGTKLKRMQLDAIIRSDEGFANTVLEYQFLMGVIVTFAYSEFLPILVEPMSPIFAGGFGSRSDIDVQEMLSEGGKYVSKASSMTRQIGISCTGALASKHENLSVEGGSVTKKLIRMKNKEYPNLIDATDYRNIIAVLTTLPESIAKESELCLLPFDFGITTSDVSLGADMIHGSWLQLKLRDRYFSFLMSGDAMTMGLYIPIHEYFATHIPYGKILAFGDDINIIVPKSRAQEVMDVMHPYTKRKSEFTETDVAGHKVLGRLSIFDNSGSVISMLTPRGLKTETTVSGSILKEWNGEFTVSADELVTEDINRFYSMYPNFVYLETTRERYKEDLLGAYTPEMIETLMEQGHMSWMTDLVSSAVDQSELN